MTGLMFFERSARYAQQLGYGVAFGVLLDTFFVRSLLIPSIANLLGPLKWRPSTPRTSPGEPAEINQPEPR